MPSPTLTVSFITGTVIFGFGLTLGNNSGVNSEANWGADALKAKPKAGSVLAGFASQSILVNSQSEENMFFTPLSVSTFS